MSMSDEDVTRGEVLAEILGMYAGRSSIDKLLGQASNECLGILAGAAGLDLEKFADVIEITKRAYVEGLATVEEPLTFQDGPLGDACRAAWEAAGLEIGRTDGEVDKCRLKAQGPPAESEETHGTYVVDLPQEGTLDDTA